MVDLFPIVICFGTKLFGVQATLVYKYLKGFWS